MVKQWLTVDTCSCACYKAYRCPSECSPNRFWGNNGLPSGVPISNFEALCRKQIKRLIHWITCRPFDSTPRNPWTFHTGICLRALRSRWVQFIFKFILKSNRSLLTGFPPTSRLFFFSLVRWWNRDLKIYAACTNFYWTTWLYIGQHIFDIFTGSEFNINPGKDILPTSNAKKVQIRDSSSKAIHLIPASSDQVNIAVLVDWKKR